VGADRGGGRIRAGVNLVGLVPGRTPGLERWALDTLPVLGAARPDVDWVAFLGREAAAPWAGTRSGRTSARSA